MGRKKLGLERVSVGLDQETFALARARFAEIRKAYGPTVSWSGYLSSLIKQGLGIKVEKK